MVFLRLLILHIMVEIVLEILSLVLKVLLGLMAILARVYMLEMLMALQIEVGVEFLLLKPKQE